MLLCCCEVLRRAIEKGTDTEYYCVFVWVWEGQNREELILNVILFVVRVWGGQYREELLLNVSAFFVRF
jgi:hypothetical protein